MNNKLDLIAGFEEALDIMLNSKAFREYSSLMNTLKLRMYSMVTDNDIFSLIEMIISLNPNSIADIGCGSGDLIKYIADNKLVNNCVGFEISESMAIKIHSLNNSRAVIKFGDIDNTIDEKFDFIYCIDALYFVNDMKNSIYNMINMLNRKGVCVIYYSDHKYSITGESCIEMILKDMNISFTVEDITTHEEASWRLSLKSLEKTEHFFKDENLNEMLNQMKKEAIMSLENNEKYSCKRFKYIIYK